MLQNLCDVDNAIDRNAEVADSIFESGLQTFNLPKDAACTKLVGWPSCTRGSDADKAHSTIRQLYRDWSADGLQERKPCYDYALKQLRATFGCPSASSSPPPPPKILVPGAGLGRLVYEICRAGFDVEGNEISYHQLLTSSWVLNHAGPNPHAVYPFASSFTSLCSRQQQLRKVMVPDVHPGQALSQASVNGERVGQMNMTAGDFLLLYSGQEHQAKFDAVVTMFFIDTAPNFIRYVETVSNCLKANGIWVNVGPLLWHSDLSLGSRADKSGAAHWTDERGEKEIEAENRGIGEPGSFELTEEEVIWLLEKEGFKIEQREVASDGVGYIQDTESLLQHMYLVTRWVAKKTG
jgi:carnosine N-methyltransferase